MEREGRKWKIKDKWTPEVIEAIDPSVSVTSDQWEEITRRLQKADNPFDLETKNEIVRKVLAGSWLKCQN